VKKIVYIAAAFAITAIAGIQLVPTDSAIRLAPSQAPLLVGAQPNPAVASIIERSCQNCHSLKTEWPAYSRVFPFSLLIENDVATARDHMNLSRWQSYDDGEKNALLAEIGSVVRNHIMPPPRYTFVHPAAKLSDADANEICRWTKTERRLLRNSPAE
jgi:hypothetical protein